jgi:hypothetical protein
MSLVGIEPILHLKNLVEGLYMTVGIMIRGYQTFLIGCIYTTSLFGINVCMRK